MRIRWDRGKPVVALNTPEAKASVRVTIGFFRGLIQVPKDDYAKYNRRDRGRAAAASGEFFRAGDYARKQKPAKAKPKRKPRGYSCKYIGTYDSGLSYAERCRLIREYRIKHGLVSGMRPSDVLFGIAPEEDTDTSG